MNSNTLNDAWTHFGEDTSNPDSYCRWRALWEHVNRACAELSEQIRAAFRRLTYAAN